MLYDRYIPNRFCCGAELPAIGRALESRHCIPQYRPYFSTFLNSIARMAPMFEGVLVSPFGAPDAKIK
jgi:hypothetical protein